MIRPHRFVPAVLVGLVVTAPLLAQPPAAEKKPAPSKFIRLATDDKGQPAALETALTRYVPADGKGVTVDLVSVVHIGDRGYYQKLDKLLGEYDVVLYELVAPQGTRVPKGGRRDGDNPVAFLQQIIKSLLGLELQTEQIDYTRKHFIHADLSPEEMVEAVRKRGDDGLTLLLGITADFLRMQNLQEMKRGKEPARAEPEIDPLELLLDPNGPVKLKRLLAKQLAEAASPEAGLGQTLTTILIADRNQAALKVFQKELAKGTKKIAIFYGAGHMADFEKRLREDFGLKKESEQWLPAWDLRLRR
jgi:hypothetical protein